MSAHFFRFCVWLQDSSVGAAMRNSLYPFPAIETIHIFGLVILVGSASLLDLRLLGLMFKEQPVSTVAKHTMPWIWAGFLIQLMTGFLLFASKAQELYGSPTFRLKMLLIVLSGVNVLLFYWFPYRSLRSWDTAPKPPLVARIVGCISILLWLGVITAGRLIAYY